MKKKLTLTLFILSAFFLSACSLLPSQKESNPDSTSQESFDDTIKPALEEENMNQTQDNTKDSIVALNTKYGQIVIKLFPDKAPKTVENFLNKVNSGFYNGLTFHRVEPGFVVQGGDPLGTGTGGGTLKSEINDIPFTRASLGLARGGIKEQSNDSQFFICLAKQTCQHLTGEYVNFGQVLLGMDFVDQIKVGDKMISIVTQTK